MRSIKHWNEGAFHCEEQEDVGDAGILLGKHYYTNGNRGVIFKADLRQRSSGDGAADTLVAVKENIARHLLKPGRMQVEGTLKNEAEWLKRLNSMNIGPSLLHSDPLRVVTEFIQGRRLLTFLAEEGCEGCERVIIGVLEQLRVLDTIGVQKGELTKPDRHVLVSGEAGRERVVLLDFERCRYCDAPRNITQFCQFLGGAPAASALTKGGKGIVFDQARLWRVAQAWIKGRYADASFRDIVLLVETTCREGSQGAAGEAQECSEGSQGAAGEAQECSEGSQGDADEASASPGISE